jgi:acetyl esterase/lipase
MSLRSQWCLAREHHGAFQRCIAVHRRFFNLAQLILLLFFHVGENDSRCPKSHSETAFRALKEYLKVESELVVYPGESHGLTKYASRKAKLSWELAWFDHFVKGLPKP